MWFWLSLIALLCWSGSDLFSKIGCRDEDDRLSHLKMVMAVGVVMGLHAAFEIFVGGTEISFSIILTYLPVSLLYIGSMTLGYLGLRYIELSVSSPICNSSGALVAVMTLVFLGGEDYSPLAIFAVLLVCAGAIGLGVVDATEDPELRAARQAEGNRKYAKSFLALALRRAPAVRLRRAGDCRLERHLAVALAQRQHRLGAVEVAALRHAADKVRIAVLHSPGDHLAQPRLEPQAAFVALVRPPRQLRRAVTREAAAHRFSAHPHSSPRRFLFIIEHSFLFVKCCFSSCIFSSTVVCFSQT